MSGIPDASTAPFEAGFLVFSQKLELDIDFSNRAVEGKTEITIQPLSKDLKTIRLNCRQSAITRISVAGKTVHPRYQEPFSRLSAPPKSGVHQHHILRTRLEPQLEDPPVTELAFTLPRGVQIKESKQGAVTEPVPLTVQPTTARLDDGQALIETPTTSAPSEPVRTFELIKINVEFKIENIRDGLHFVGLEEGDTRYPHVYTRNSSFPGTACCIFPCVDSLAARCTWEISIRCPRTLGDAFTKSGGEPLRVSNVESHGSYSHSTSPPAGLNSADGLVSKNRQDNVVLSEEEKLLDLLVVCSGDLTDDIVDPQDPSKKTVSFACAERVSPNQIGFAIGPFEDVDLSEFREIDDDEKLGANSIRVHGFCLPGRAEEVRNTCLPLAKALDFFTTTFTIYPYESYNLCFVDDLFADTVNSAGLSLCSTRLLFPQDIIETLEPVTRQMVQALSTQYAGIMVFAKEPSDSWAIAGMSHFMTELFWKHLSGHNEYRYQQKKAADRVYELDFERPSLYLLGSILPLDASESELLDLKAGVVYFILDRRLTKAGGSAGMIRIICRVLKEAKGDSPDCDGLSTAQFQRICEKVGHLKLDTFFQQWVYGAGCPHFVVRQRFNKKKLVVEMTVSQIQAERAGTPRDLNPETFIRDVKEDMREIYAGNMQPVFTGPMTIRIHEADGTPYEHIVEIKEANSRFEIPYNTKYKRLKRSRRQKERAAAAVGMDVVADAQDDVLLYCLGDVLQSQEEVSEWRLVDWSKENEEQMSQESYEWIRMDADFEWICKMTINMPAYMFVSQLQQDRDVVAQMQSIQFMAGQQGHPLISTILTRTVMDRRYFHGIRTMAAAGLAKCATNQTDWIGLFHLEKIFQELFCFPNSSIVRSNDFSDRASYLVQRAIPQAIAMIKDNSGRAPMRVKRFFMDKLKFNDNSNNEFSDSNYLALLLSCLAETLAKPKQHDVMTDDEWEQDVFENDAINEIERYKRIDEWICSYHNVFSVTALECVLRLCKNNVMQPKLAEFVQYTHAGNSDMLRLAAFSCLAELGMLRNDAILRYFLYSLSVDVSPYMRENIFRIFGKGLALVALGDKDADAKNQLVGGLIVEQESSLVEARQADIRRRTSLDGALEALRTELGDNQILKKALWDAVTSPYITIREMSNLLDLCALLYDEEDSLVVALRYPRYWRVSHVGQGVLKFSRTDRYRTTPIPRFPVPQTAPPALLRRKASATPAPPAKPVKTVKLTSHRPSLPDVVTNMMPDDSGNATTAKPAPVESPKATPRREILKLKIRTNSLLLNGSPASASIKQRPLATPIKQEPSSSVSATNGRPNGMITLKLNGNAKSNGTGVPTPTTSAQSPPPPSDHAMSPPPRPPSRRGSTPSSTSSGGRRKSAGPKLLIMTEQKIHGSAAQISQASPQLRTDPSQCTEAAPGKKRKSSTPLSQTVASPPAKKTMIKLKFDRNGANGVVNGGDSPAS